jgi:penicillin-binding protein 1A
MKRIAALGMATGLLAGGGIYTASEFWKDPTILLTPDMDLPNEIPLNDGLATIVCGAVIELGQCNEAVLGSISAGERKVVPLDKISPFVVEAIIGSEDRSFYSHPGVSGKGVTRAFLVNGWETFKNQKFTFSQGASTLTMMDVDWRYGSDLNDSINEKKREAELALGLEKQLEIPCAEILGLDSTETYLSGLYPADIYQDVRGCVKDQVLSDLLNRIYFGRQSYGIETASQNYFGIEALKLQQRQAIFIIATIKSPDLSDLVPTQNPFSTLQEETERLRDRYSIIVEDLLSGDAITSEERTRLLSEFDMTLAEVIPFDPVGGLDTSPAKLIGAEHVTVRAMNEASDILGITLAELASGGYSIVTTIDMEHQRVAGDIARLAAGDQQEYQLAMTAIRADGGVISMVGGLDRNTSQVNLATGVEGGGSGRNLGSTNKIALVASALEQGFTAQDVFTVPASITLEGANNGEPYIIKTGDACKRVTSQNAPCQMTLYQMTAGSSNTGFGKVLGQSGTAPAYGAERMYEIKRGLGSDIQGSPVASAIVGSGDGSPYGEATYVNGLLLNSGARVDPYLVAMIYDGSGKLIYQHKPSTEVVQVVSPEVSRSTTQILRAPVEEVYGTAYGAFPTPPNTVAGKTGTAGKGGGSKENTDLWFTGVASDNETGGIAFSFWLGNPKGRIALPSDLSSNDVARLAGAYIIGIGAATDGSQL